MSRAEIDAIARAVLFEGYALYPYRTSSLKNRRPSLLGAVLPHGPGAAPSFVEAVCLVEVDRDCVLDVRARFLQLTERQPPDGPAWHEAEERTVEITGLAVGAAPVSSTPTKKKQTFICSSGDARIEGALSVGVETVVEGLVRITARLENATEIRGAISEASGALAAAHLVLDARGGRFVSAIDPPAHLAGPAAACRSTGLFPVLVGAESARATVLAAPFALGDHPRIAPESGGDLFDATEIDEILTLRILTMTDDEKRDARAHDPRVRALLDRVETLASADLAILHGARRDGGSPFAPGKRVLLRPRRRADVFDLALAGRAATIASVERDLEGRAFVTVTVDDDPGRDLGALGQVGHRFFFDLDEVEALP